MLSPLATDHTEILSQVSRGISKIFEDFPVSGEMLNKKACNEEIRYPLQSITKYYKILLYPKKPPWEPP